MNTLEDLVNKFNQLENSIGTVISGQGHVVRELVVACLCGGHVLLEGVPGVAKTLMAKSLASSLDLDFKRIQFTPDMMPADVVGTSIFDFQHGKFNLVEGPIFTQVLLADEINRSPPKTQAALLEAMQERQVTVDGSTKVLKEPFFVIATQNPIDQEGTYPLPEAQLDRFLIKIQVGYPQKEDELDVYKRFIKGDLNLNGNLKPLKPVLTGPDLLLARELVKQVHIEPKILNWVYEIVDATRSHKYLSNGASPRAAMSLLAASRALAAIEGKSFVLPEQVKSMIIPVFGHRLIPTPEAELEGNAVQRAISQILDSIEVPR